MSTISRSFYEGATDYVRWSPDNHGKLREALLEVHCKNDSLEKTKEKAIFHSKFALMSKEYSKRKLVEKKKIVPNHKHKHTDTSNII